MAGKWLDGINPLDALLKGTGGKGGSGTLGEVVRTAGTVFQTIQSRRAERRMDENVRREAERQNEVLASPPTIHGTAHWATEAELRQASLLHPPDHFENPSSILIGGLPDSFDETADNQGWLHWDGKGHLLTAAPSQSGKSYMLIVANLLRYRGSAVILDPKGELYKLTSAWRATLGPVYRLAPFDGGGNTATAAYPRHGFNPLANVKTSADARVLADMMIPDDPKASGFFKADAVNFITAVILFVQRCAPPDRRTFAEVRRIISKPGGELPGILSAMQNCGEPLVVSVANSVDTKKGSPNALPSLRATLDAATLVWDDDAIKSSIQTDDIAFGSLKDQVATVYIDIPFEKLDPFSSFVKVVLSSAIDAMLTNPRVPDVPVLFLLDEFLELGAFDKFLRAINTHASAGVRLWFFVQNVGRLQALYGESWINFMDVAVRIFFGTRDGSTSKMVSADLGPRTAAWRSATMTLNESSSRSGMFGEERSTTAGTSFSSTVNITGQTLLDPAEVQRRLGRLLSDGSRHAVVFAEGLTILARLMPYTAGQRASRRLGAHSV